MAERLDEPNHHDRDVVTGEPDPTVANAPLEKGTDPLGDNRKRYRRNGQLAFSCALVVLFAVLTIIDLVRGSYVPGALALVLTGLNIYIAMQERAKPPAPR